jgi:MFS family permease
VTTPSLPERTVSRRYAWYVVALLALAYAFSLLDRWILSLVVEPVKAHFAATDEQVGLLLGPAFAIFYIVFGFLFGWLADRGNRTRIIGCAMLLPDDFDLRPGTQFRPHADCPGWCGRR